MMFQGWRLKLREADEALTQGRLHDAERIVRSAKLLDYLPGRRLGDKVALELAKRARTLLLHEEASEAWREMALARSLGGDTERILAIRREMTELALGEVETRLQAGDLAGSRNALAQIEPHGTHLDSLRQLRTVAEKLEKSRHLADRGKFVEAAEQLTWVLGVHPGWTPLAERRDHYEKSAIEVRQISHDLHRALATENWNDAVTLSDQLLALAPECQLARDVRRRAWAKVGSPLNDSRRLAETHAWERKPLNGKTLDGKTLDGTPREVPSSMDRSADESRFLLWIDGVGGYLVCTRAEFSIGQAAPGNDVDLGLLGDLSRRHAVIRREGDAYLLEAIASVRVQGRLVERAVSLRDGDRIELGNSVQLRFRQPHALSATARLEFVSRHRPQPSVDGILLMAESCVLGPRKSNHVLCRDWARDVVLYRRENKLYCRAGETLEIDGKLCEGRGEITRRSRVIGDDFTLSLEPVV